MALGEWVWVGYDPVVPWTLPRRALAAPVIALLVVPSGCRCEPGPTEPAGPTAGEASPAADRAEAALTRKRERMVTEHLAARDITDERVLTAMRTVRRHRFVPRRAQSQAYVDSPLSIGHDQTISQPYIVALMSQLLELDGDERVLEVGTGSGYQAAVLAQLAAEVHSIEIVEPLCASAAATLAAEGYEGVQVHCGDGYQGWPDAAPYDAIIVTAAPDHVPQPLLDQLASGGRLVIPVGPQLRAQELQVWTKDAAGEVTVHNVLAVAFVPMTGEARGK